MVGPAVDGFDEHVVGPEFQGADPAGDGDGPAAAGQAAQDLEILVQDHLVAKTIPGIVSDIVAAAVFGVADPGHQGDGLVGALDLAVDVGIGDILGPANAGENQQRVRVSRESRIGRMETS